MKLRQTLDVRFHKQIKEKDLNDWAQYYWEMGGKINTLIISSLQLRSLLEEQAKSMNINHIRKPHSGIKDKRTRGGKWLDNQLNPKTKKEVIRVYETDFQTILLKVED